MSASSLVPEILEYKVSSVLNGDRKVYGKKFLFDGKEDTCWNSDQGLPQWIHFKFSEPRTITTLRLQFQGGFAGKDCELEDLSNTNPDKVASRFQFTPSDINRIQEFNLPLEITSTDFRLNFKTTTDFYGRIIIYQLDIIGK